MTDLLDKAIASARTLPSEMQDEVARLVLDFVGDERGSYRFTPEEAAELDESEAAARGEFVSDEEMRAIWAKHGL